MAGKAATTKKRGRPSEYTQKTADLICSELAEGRSMRTVLKSEGMPAMPTVWRWIRDRDDFRKQYTLAKQEASDAMAEDMLDIADDVHDDYETRVNAKTGEEYEVVNSEAILRARLRVETRKWLMAKMKPKKYGDHTEVDFSTSNPVMFVNEVPHNQPVPDVNKDS